ncbi:MAG TPA: Stk1 family PASTA domain-containing Ser/Thr kinase [Micromonosporaceae bacterium]
MDTQAADILLGSLIDGRYRILARVARGGMATVYTAADERLDRTVAIKIIHPAQARSAQARLTGFLDRFTQEAKTIARLTHPNVVAVYDQGTHNGLPYLAMEYVRGRTLREILAERRRLEPAEALAIVEQILAGIAAAHRAGMVHRDVKPENVLIAESPSGGVGNLIDSVVKVADFGLAQAVEASTEVDGGGQLMATAAYVAPELVRDGHADPRTDVYSAGIVLFEMLTGRVPYEGDRAVEVAWQHVDRDVPPPSTLVAGLPPALDELVLRATRRNPAVRPTDAGVFLTEVQAIRDVLGDTSRTTVLRQVQVAEPTMQVRVADPTIMVAPISAGGPHDNRPAWARLPEPKTQPRRRRAAAAPRSDGPLGSVRARLMADSRALTAVLVVLGLLVLFGGWWLAVGRYTDAPQLVNLTKAEAEALAAREGFTLRYAQPRHDEKVEKDVVLGQDPGANARIVKGGTITLTLSLGPEHYLVPDVVGKTYDLAVADLEKVDARVERTDKFDDNLPEGVVIAVDPQPNTEIQPGDVVKVTVSKGRAPITVPNLVGKHIMEARAILQQMGLVPRETYTESDQPKDQVIGQSPIDGSGVEKGAEIKLDVSMGPPTIPMPRVIDMQCLHAQNMLAQQGFEVHIRGDQEKFVKAQNPPENTLVAPGARVVIRCD